MFPPTPPPPPPCVKQQTLRIVKFDWVGDYSCCIINQDISENLNSYWKFYLNKIYYNKNIKACVDYYLLIQGLVTKIMINNPKWKILHKLIPLILPLLTHFSLVTSTKKLRQLVYHKIFDFLFILNVIIWLNHSFGLGE